MGFYSPSTIVRDAQQHGVEVREVGIEASCWDSTLEPVSDGPRKPSEPRRALRHGFRLIKGLGEVAARTIEVERARRRFSSLDDLVRRGRLKKNEVEALAEAGALETLVEGRRHALWKARAPRVNGLFSGVDVAEPEVALAALAPVEQLLLDYDRKGLSIDDHPMRHLRKRLARRRVSTMEALQSTPQGGRVTVAGLVLSRQRPGTASGVVFITLEDETGIGNLILYSGVFEKFEHVARHATLLLARGKVERQVTPPRPGEVGAATPVVHLVVRHVERLDVPGQDIESVSRDFH
jgi:error-prone DNA polymerase